MSDTKNPIAVALGKLAKGKPKNFTKAELRRRKVRMEQLNFVRRGRINISWN